MAKQNISLVLPWKVDLIFSAEHFIEERRAIPVIDPEAFEFFSVSCCIPEVSEMRRKSFFKAVLLWGFFLLANGPVSHAQHALQPPRSLTLLYSNNINGEIDPCPG